MPSCKTILRQAPCPSHRTSQLPAKGWSLGTIIMKWNCKPVQNFFLKKSCFSSHSTNNLVKSINIFPAFTAHYNHLQGANQCHFQSQSWKRLFKRYSSLLGFAKCSSCCCGCFIQMIHVFTIDNVTIRKKLQVLKKEVNRNYPPQKKKMNKNAWKK